ncbi:hypothetical protein [Micromonospora zamorensis]|uniref:Uncharacterized protein n=1 Tax=Micromonospora zamorensis TaxID=709883 RepID=A0ABZ1PQQ5_9ACTN
MAVLVPAGSVVSSRTAAAVLAGFEQGDHFADERDMLLVHGMSAYTKTGVIGQPSAGTAEKGRALLHSLAEAFGRHLTAVNSERSP